MGRGWVIAVPLPVGDLLPLPEKPDLPHFARFVCFVRLVGAGVHSSHIGHYIHRGA